MKYTCLILIALACYSTACTAQAMPGMKMDGNNKSVYLGMMDSMMLAMNKSPEGATTGDYFLFQMIPHHEGALAMANYEIGHGKNFEMKQIAKNINAEQKSEIQLMQIWLKSSLADNKITGAYKKAIDATMATMMSAMPGDKSLNNSDRSFALIMIPHHQAAIDMAGVLLKYDSNQALRSYAEQMISNEKNDIEQMKDILTKSHEN